MEKNFMISYVPVLFSKKTVFSVKKKTTLVFIDKECGNLKVFVDGVDLTRNINQKKSYLLQACRCPLRDRFHQ